MSIVVLSDAVVPPPVLLRRRCKHAVDMSLRMMQGVV
jgi:hypothetical protein